MKRFNFYSKFIFVIVFAIFGVMAAKALFCAPTTYPIKGSENFSPKTYPITSKEAPTPRTYPISLSKMAVASAESLDGKVLSTEPKLSIVIDDFGSYDQSGVEKMISCPERLTCAVMPNVDNTESNIRAIREHGHEVILHMPMQSHVNLPENWYGPVYIANHDTPEVAVKKLSSCMEKFEGVRGLNIHIGSGVSRNEKLMSAIYNFAKEHNLYFLDSRTIETHATENACKNTNSIYLGRDVFLEADKNRSYEGVVRRLLEGANIAKEKGCAIVIGHVGAEGGENTARAILDTLPKIKEMGVKIVPLSEIYEEMSSTGVMSNMPSNNKNA